jgi:glycosyltransferase involved in cell wall biosynthesis
LSRAVTANPNGYLLVGPWTIFEPGGVSKVVASLGRELRRSGYWNPVYLELSASNSVTLAPDGSTLYRARVRSYPSRRSTLKARLAFVLTLLPTLLRVLGIVRRHRIRVINVHYPTYEIWPYVLLRRFGLYRGRLLLSVHGSDVRVALQGITCGGGRVPEVYSVADAIIACSGALAAEVAKLDPALQGKTHVVHNGFTVAPHSRNVGRPEGSERPAGSSRQILSVAAFEEKKGLDVLLDAFALCLRQDSNLRLKLVGQKQAAYGALVEQARSLGLSDRVEFLLDVPNERVLEMMAEADVFVLPSRIEPFGIVLLEAGSVGLPIVATNVGGIPEIVTSGEHGLLVASNDAAALGSAILQTLREPEASRERAARMRERVASEFSWAAVLDKYEAILSSLES